MKVVIVGGGLLGLSSAQVLQERGADVELLEAREGVGLEASYANGGFLTVSTPKPFNAPGVHKHLLASVLDPHSSMKLRPRVVPSLFFWGLKFLRNSTASRSDAVTDVSYRLAIYSVQKTEALRERLGLNYDAGGGGAIKVFRQRSAMASSRALAQRLAAYGMRYEETDAEGAVSREPQLAAIRDKIAGALYFPDDNRGDAHLFCRELARVVQATGGSVRTGVNVHRLIVEKGRVKGVETDQGLVHADHVVVAAGCHSPLLLKSVGLSLPIKPCKGYSLTLSTEGIDDLPKIPVIDDSLHAGVVPLGHRLRIAGTAEFTGFDTSIPRYRIDNIFALLKAVYPRIAARIDRRNEQPYACLRPLSCDGKPFIGPTRIDGLYLNTGHGPMGWTWAMGSACLLADLMTGRTTEIDGYPFRTAR